MKPTSTALPLPERPIILTGFMGCGKSSVGRVLATLLELPLIDLDAEIVATQRRTISEIFTQDGEPAFRILESACLEKVLKAGPAVIATGGGAVIAETNRRMMAAAGVVVHLHASQEQLLRRLEGSTDRPLYSDESARERVKTLLEQREQFYNQADIRIDTDGKSVEDVAAEILRILKGLHL